MAVKKAVASSDATVKATEKVAEVKKTEVKAPAKKAAAPKAEAKKAEAPKAEVKKAEAPKAEVKKAAAPKTEAKKVAAPKTAAKAPAKKAAPKATKTVAEVKIQIADREYTQEELVKIANDVWVYDLDKKASELKKVQLFYKAEDFKVYYVFNDEITGEFNI